MWVDFLAGIDLGDTFGCSASLGNNDRFVKLVHAIQSLEMRMRMMVMLKTS